MVSINSLEHKGLLNETWSIIFYELAYYTVFRLVVKLEVSRGFLGGHEGFRSLWGLS